MEDVTLDINFFKLFKIMLLGMRVNRSHPDIPKDRKWMCQFFVTHGVCFLICCLLIYSTILNVLKEKDFTQTCANGILSIIFYVVTFQYAIMIYYQDLLKSLMNEMKFDYEIAKTLSLYEYGIVLNYAKRGKQVVVLWLVISITIASLFPIKALFLMAYYWIKGEFKLVHLCDLTYPSPIEEMKSEFPVYFSLFGLFLFYDLYAMTMYIASVPLGPILMLHGCGQLKLVEYRIMTIFKKCNSEKSSLENLNDIVRDLQKIYCFIDRIKDSFEILYELSFKGTIIILPFSLYQVIELFHHGELGIEFIAIIIGSVSFSSIPCYYSDLLMDMGEKVRLAVYMCGWEAHLDQHKELRTTLLLIQSRAERPVAIRTTFRTISLDALADIYQQSYAIFNVLNAAWN